MKKLLVLAVLAFVLLGMWYTEQPLEALPYLEGGGQTWTVKVDNNWVIVKRAVGLQMPFGEYVLETVTGNDGVYCGIDGNGTMCYYMKNDIFTADMRVNIDGATYFRVRSDNQIYDMSWIRKLYVNVQ